MQGFPNDLLTDVRTHLEEEKRRIDQEIQALSHQDPFTDNDRSVDNAASDTEANEQSSHDRFAAMVDELTIKRDAINDALMRIASGRYGFCVSCQQMIDTDRLNILPTATLCRSCEEKRRKGR